MMARFKMIGLALVLTVVGSLMITGGANAQVGPWAFIGADGRVSTYDFTCHGDAYAYAHVMIHTSAGRRVLSFSQSCSSRVGSTSILASLANFPTLLDTDGVIERIDVIGYQRYNSTLKHIWDFVRSTRTDTVDEEIHAGNLAEQVNDNLEPVSTVSVYVYSSPPVP